MSSKQPRTTDGGRYFVGIRPEPTTSPPTRRPKMSSEQVERLSEQWRVFLRQIKADGLSVVSVKFLERRLEDLVEIEQALDASQQEVERLREFLNDIGYPDTAINVILDAAEVVDALEEQEVQ